MRAASDVLKHPLAGKSLNTADVNCGPLFDMTSSGMPYRAKCLLNIEPLQPILY